VIVRRVTIKDVAAHVGVSYQTVSRVINDRPDVAPKTRKRVLQAIEELGYQPSAIARSLVSQRTHTLGLITADFSDYFFTQVIGGAEIAARERGYFFILGSSERKPEDEPVYVRLLTERQVEGILFARPSTEKDTSHIRALLHQGVPLVTTAYYLEGEKLTVVDVDNVDGGQQATECLVRSGHRNIGLIKGPAGWKSVDDRTRGYKLALERRGIHFREELIEGGDWSEESGYKAMKRLLQKAPQITALFAQNDRMAIGAMRALREAGRRIPEDVAVVGYDDIPVAAYCEPPLSTIRQPMREVGRVAAELLLEAIENPEAERRMVLLKAELIIRESCGGGR